MSRRTTRRQIIVRNLMWDSLDALPTPVFPVKASIVMSRNTAADGFLNDDHGNPIKTDHFPLAVKMAAGQPYIPSKTVYFENPAWFPEQNQKYWRFEDFAERMKHIVERIELHDPTATGAEDDDQGRLYIESLKLVEVPERYVYEDRQGYRSVNADLYQDRAEMNIADFTKRAKIKNPDVRGELQDEMNHESRAAPVPGRVLKPLELTEARTVHAKEHRGSNMTTAASTRRRFFSEKMAEKYSDSTLAPSGMIVEWNNIRTDFPALSSSRFMELIEFEGELTDRQEFVESRARVVSGSAPGAN